MKLAFSIWSSLKLKGEIHNKGIGLTHFSAPLDCPFFLPPGHDAGTGWAAHLAGCIAVGEAYALIGDPVDVRAFVEAASFHAQVAPAEVVSQDKEHIGVVRFLGGQK